MAGGKDRLYHLNKTIECEKQGITLLQFTDREIEDKSDLVRSMLSYHLKSETMVKIPARKCSVVDLDTRQAKEFLNCNHIQGSERGSIKKGLIFQGDLVACMVASKPRYSKDFDLEVVRFCSKQNTQVQGGFSKIIKSLGSKSLISYADRRYSRGKVYESSGWALLHQSAPAYHYTQDYQTLYHRTSFQKHLLRDKLEIFVSSLSEWENMLLNGWDRLWDCGNLVYRHKPQEYIC